MATRDAWLKTLSQSLSGGAMEAIGVQGVELADPLPTELPAGALRLDYVWRMQDGCVFHLEYQDRREPTLHRFLEYDTRLARAHQAELRTVVLYHSAVRSAPDTLDIGTARYRVENVYLAQQDGDAALDAVERHLHAHEWDPEDRLRLALALAMDVREREWAFERVLRLVPQIPDEVERDLAISAVLALAGKNLDDEQRIRLRREWRTVSRLVEEFIEDGKLEGRVEGRAEERKKIARAMLEDGESVERIMKFTGLSQAQVEALLAQRH